jgi:hypothetical protein
LRVRTVAYQRLLRGHVGQQAEDSQADQKPVGSRPGTDAERGAQRGALRTRQMIQAIEHRRAQLMHGREREFHLRLDTRGAYHPASRRVPGQVVQQRRLAHPRLATHHQRPAFAGAHGLDQPVEHGAFAAPSL